MHTINELIKNSYTHCHHPNSPPTLSQYYDMYHDAFYTYQHLIIFEEILSHQKLFVQMSDLHWPH